MPIKKNTGGIDRAIRIIVGSGLIVAGLAWRGGLQGRSEGLLLAGLGAFMLLVAAVGFCPLYVPFGFSTRKRRPAGPTLWQR